MRLLLLMPAVLAGCATLADLQATVGNASNFQLCRAMILASSDVANIARGEAARRGLDCAPYAAAVMQQEQANNAATNALARQLLTPAPRPFPAPVTCETYRAGTSLQTTCR